MLKLLEGRVGIERDVVYGTGGGRELRCDVYRPPLEGGDRPAVLIIHGGAWQIGDKSQLQGYGIQLARYGFVAVACEYRLSGESKWPAQIHDVKAAMRWIRANVNELGVDEDKIAVLGNSAGAHLALMLGAETDLLDGEGGNPGVSARCAAIVAIYPPTELRASEIGGAVTNLLGSDATPEVAEAASPIRYASASFPPTMLIHGNRDELVPVRASFDMYHALNEAGGRAELHIYEGAPHAFDGVPDFGRQCLQLMTLFLDRMVVNPRPVAVDAG